MNIHPHVSHRSVPEGISTLTRFTTIGVTGGPGKLLGFDLTVWSNDPDARKGEEGPGAPIVSMEVTSFTSELTGRFWFFDDRPEMKITVTFEPVELPSGRYWLEMNLHFSRTWFQMAKDGDLIRDNPMRLLYTDFNDSPFPGREIFGVDWRALIDQTVWVVGP